MHRYQARDKHIKTPATATNTFAHYLILPSEPEENIRVSRLTFQFRNRYLTKRRVMRAIRRMRRTQV